MDAYLESLLRDLIAGVITLDECSARIQSAQRAYIDVEGAAKLDLDRKKRTGIPEAVFCPGKTVDQIASIARRFIENGFTNVIGSRAEAETAAELIRRIPGTEYHPHSRILLFNPAPRKDLAGLIGIVAAGTSDMSVAEEADIVCSVLGSRSVMITDVGVASIQRLFAHLEEIRKMNVLIVVAGMEGALPSVVAGLVDLPVIAVPASIGYGVNAGGYNALLSSLGSCVPGVMTVNIDNGFGAACAAHTINLAIEKAARASGHQ